MGSSMVIVKSLLLLRTLLHALMLPGCKKNNCGGRVLQRMWISRLTLSLNKHLVNASNDFCKPGSLLCLGVPQSLKKRVPLLSEDHRKLRSQ